MGPRVLPPGLLGAAVATELTDPEHHSRHHKVLFRYEGIIYGSGLALPFALPHCPIKNQLILSS